MSSASEVAKACVDFLRTEKITTIDLGIDGDGVVTMASTPVLNVPPEERAWSWRTTVNKSFLPASISAESRRHLLYAVLQDLVRPELLLHQNTATAPLADYNADLAPFDSVYRVPAERRSDRDILFPLHMGVPTVFDTYERAPKLKAQTDKGFRGKFLEFFGSNEAGLFDSHLLEVLRNLFSRTEGLTSVDKALVAALAERISKTKATELSALLQVAGTSPPAGGPDWWSTMYRLLPPSHSEFRPLDEFAAQGARLRQDIDAIAHTPGLSRIERVAFVERLLAYHFALYMVRLTRLLYRELDWVHRKLWPGRGASSWAHYEELKVQYFERQSQVSRDHNAAYQLLMERLNEAYLLLPVLNNVELAIRSVAGTGEAAQMRNLAWAEAKQLLNGFDGAKLQATREMLTLLALVGRTYVGFKHDSFVTDLAPVTPMELVFDAIRLHYSDPQQKRYPKDHHQVVFDAVAGEGSTSFLQRQPFKHVVLGDELIYLMVLTLFEHREGDQRGKTDCVPRDPRRLRRQRLTLARLEERLAADLLVPASDAARTDLRAALSRLGLLDRLSDVGDANFLRHPTGI